MGSILLEYTLAEQQANYFHVVKFWASVVWHYPNSVNKRQLHSNITKLKNLYRQGGITNGS